MVVIAVDIVYSLFPLVVLLEPEIVVLVAAETSVVLVFVLKVVLAVWLLSVPVLAFFCWMQ